LDEAQLVQALESGALGGAALDVAQTEPLPAESSLWKAPNLFITPHTSGVSDRLWDRQAAILIELLERWFDGRELFITGWILRAATERTTKGRGAKIAGENIKRKTGLSISRLNDHRLLRLISRKNQNEQLRMAISS